MEADWHRPASPDSSTVQSFGVRRGSVGFQGITQHGKFARCGVEQAVEEVINLGGIDGQQGEAGVQMFPTLIVGTLYRIALTEDQPSGGSPRVA